MLGKKDQMPTYYIFKNHQKYTGFPHYLKVECSYEIFCKLKWCEEKKHLPFTSMEMFFYCSQIPNSTHSVFISLILIKTLNFVQPVLC